MNKKLVFCLLAFCALILSFHASAVASGIERVEPPNWWVGMKSEKLQLMVHGKDIADYQPELHYPGVRIDAVTVVGNRNYLFIDLTIKPEAQAGKFDILFKHGDALIHLPYALLARENGSANHSATPTSS